MEIVSDDEVFRAALDFVDTFVAPVDDGGDATPPNSRVRRPAPSTRLRGELIALRAEAETLQRELASLKKPLEATQPTAHPATTVLSAWEALTSRQKKRRQRAETENQELRTLVVEQARTARRLEKLLRKRCWDETNKPRCFFHGLTATKLLPGYTTLGHDALLAQVQLMYTHIYAIFGAPRFVFMAGEPEPVRSLVTRNDPQLGHALEMFESRVYPYAYRTLSDALWHPLARFAVPGEGIVGGKPDASTETSINHDLTFESEPPITPLKSALRSKIVGRRMRHDDGADVIVWAMALNGELAGQRVGTIEKMWMLARPLGDTPLTSAAIVQVYVQLTRLKGGMLGPGRCSDGGISRDAMDDYESCLRVHMDDYWSNVEELLLDRNWSQQTHDRHAQRGTATAH